MTESLPNTRAPRSRAAIMGLLARATPQELAEPLAQHWPGLVWQPLRAAETGLVMIRGRIGGDGGPFNFGEATVSRAVIALETGERGFGQLLGRNRAQAERAAIIDALAQRPDESMRVETQILAPIAGRLAAEAQQKRAETAATRVDFFTLVRAEG